MTNQPAGWERVTLSEVCSVGKDKGIPSDTPSLPFIGMEHVESDSGRVLQFAESLDYRSASPRVQPGNVLYGRLRPYLNKVFVADCETFVSGEFIPLVVGERIDSRFLMYRLLAPDFVSFAVGLNAGDRPRVKWPQIAEFPLVLPPLDEQRRIVATLEDHLSRLDSALASAITATRKVDVWLNTSLQHLITGLSNSAGERLADLDDRIPQDWRWMRLDELALTGSEGFKRGPFGSALTKSSFVPNGYKVYEQYCPINDDCSYGRYYISKDHFERLSAFAVSAGDFLVSGAGTLGRITQVPESFEPGVINQALLRLRIDRSVVDDEYFLWMFRSPFLQRKLLAGSPGTAMVNLKAVKDLKAIQVPLPPLWEQKQLVGEIRNTVDSSRRLRSSVGSAKKRALQLRRSILSSAFSGQLTKESPNV